MILGVTNAVRSRKSQELKIRRKSQLDELRWNEAQKRFHPLLRAKESEQPRLQNQNLLFIENDYDKMEFKASCLLQKLMHLLRMSTRARILEKEHRFHPKKVDTRISMENTRFLNAHSDSQTHFWGGINALITFARYDYLYMSRDALCSERPQSDGDLVCSSV